MKTNTSIELPAAPQRISIFHGRQELAEYRPAAISLYRGNPLIQALPDILTPTQARKLMARYPEYAESDRQAAPELRIHQMHTALNLFVPLPEHDSLEQRFSCLIRVGYAPRNPMQPGYWTDIGERVDSLKSRSSITPRSSSTGMSIIGTSGGGKTTSVETILQLYPQVIFHSQYEGRNFTSVQLVWLKMSCPHNGSVRSLCVNFFSAIDELLGTNYYRTYTQTRGNTVDEMLPRMARVAATHHLGVLVIDELQHLNQSKSGGKEQMLNFFCELVNRIGLPVVFIGTFKAMPILTDEFRQVRRGCGQGDFVWNRMTRGAKWNYFLETLWKYQYTAVPTMLTPELNEMLFDQTQGITDFAVKLYLLSQIRAIRVARRRQDEIITPAIVRSVAIDSLRTAQDTLNALRKNDHAELARFGDVHLLDFNACVQHVIESTRDNIAQKMMVKAAPSSTPASRVEPIGESTDLSPSNLINKTIKQAVKLGTGKKIPVYDSLKAEGVILPITDLLQAPVL
jgi:hypothetical protein